MNKQQISVNKRAAIAARYLLRAVSAAREATEIDARISAHFCDESQATFPDLLVVGGVEMVNERWLSARRRATLNAYMWRLYAAL